MNKTTKKLPKNPNPVSPLFVGNSVLIRTVTYFQVGRITHLDALEVVLDDASWIADTGRFNEALRTGVFSEVEPLLGPVSVSRGAIVDVVTWSHPLPKDVK